jgi:hypothetical protein
MSKHRKVAVQLNAGNITQLAQQDIAIILRGADDLIASGGRSQLVKILKGSKDKKILELDLNKSPVYGHYQKLPLDEVKARVDWTILNGYLDIYYNYRLPLLVYTDKGWAIERETYANELLVLLTNYATQNPHDQDMTFLNDKDRALILLLLDKIEQANNPVLLPLLQNWEANTYKKIAVRIEQVKKSIGGL